MVQFKLFITSLFFFFLLNPTQAQTNTDSTTLIQKVVDKLSILVHTKKEKRLFFVSPIAAWNNYDKTQVGLVLHNIQERKLSFLVAPMYGIGSKNLTGLASLHYTWNLKAEAVESFKVGFTARRFSYLLFPEDLAYNALRPSVTLGLKKTAKIDLSIEAKMHNIWQEFIISKNSGRATEYFWMTDLNMTYKLHHSDFELEVQPRTLFNNETLIIQNEIALKMHYNKESNDFKLRLFTGYMPITKSSQNINAPLPIFQLSGSPNLGFHWLQKDYLFEDYYLDRNGQDPFFRHQIAPSEGGFKSLTNAGNANQFFASFNISSDVGISKKVQRYFNINPFINVAVAKSANGAFNPYAEAGISFLFAQELFQIHIPVVTTKNITRNQTTVLGLTSRDWARKITFSMKFKHKL